jgi:hypothetical protein
LSAAANIILKPLFEDSSPSFALSKSLAASYSDSRDLSSKELAEPDSAAGCAAINGSTPVAASRIIVGVVRRIIFIGFEWGRVLLF